MKKRISNTIELCAEIVLFVVHKYRIRISKLARASVNVKHDCGNKLPEKLDDF